MKKNLLISIITILIIPQITFASWWNPRTWFDKEKPTSPLLQIESENADKIYENGENLPQQKTLLDNAITNEGLDRKTIFAPTPTTQKTTETTGLRTKIENLKIIQDQAISSSEKFAGRLSIVETNQQDITKKYEAVVSLTYELTERISAMEINQQQMVKKYESLLSLYKKQITTLENTLNEVIRKLNQQGQNIKALQPIVIPPSAQEPFVPCHSN